MRGLKGGKAKATGDKKLYCHQWRSFFHRLDDLSWEISEADEPSPNAEVTFRWAPAHSNPEDVAKGRLSWL